LVEPDVVTAWDALRTVLPALAFLLAGVPFAHLLGEVGFFDAVVSVVERRRRTLPVGLLWAIAAVTTVVLNLDTTIVLLTPLLLRLARRAEVDPLPLALVPLLLAASASSVLGVSNLTNLIVLERVGGAWSDLPIALAGPSLVAIVVGWWSYRRRHPTTITLATPDPLDRRALAVGSAVTGFVLVWVTVGDAYGLAPWIGLLLADAVLLLLVRRVPWRTVPVATAAAVGTVAAIVGAVVPATAADPIQRATGPAALALTTAAATVTATIVNNIPATLVGIPVGSTAGPGTWAWLLGVNLGAVFVPSGMLAGLLWRRIVTADGVALPWSAQVRHVVALAGPATIAAFATAAFTLR
jgi:arsenical pump membrane protein